jgi:hypothetical protein
VRGFPPRARLSFSLTASANLLLPLCVLPDEGGGTAATVASEVYMLGGLLYELLTAGHVPLHWLLGNVELLLARLQSTVPVPVPGVPGPGAAGLKGKSVLEAHVIDGVAIPWSVRLHASLPGSVARLAEAKGLLEGCLETDPSARLTLDALSRALEGLVAGEAAEARAAGVDAGNESPRLRGVGAERPLSGSAHSEPPAPEVIYTSLQVRCRIVCSGERSTLSKYRSVVRPCVCSLGRGLIDGARALRGGD